MRWNILRSLLLTMLGSLAFAPSAMGQTNNSYPMLMSLKPTAAIVGSSTDHELSARYNLAGATKVIVHGTGVTGEVMPNETEKPEDKARNDVMASKAKLRFTVAPDAVPGLRDFRVYTPHGVSTVGQIVIAREPVISEAADNDTPAKAQVVAIPATLCGTIEKGEDLDYFRFPVAAGTELTFHMTSQRLQNRLHDMQTRIDPVITLRSENGTTLASSDNVYAGDPLLHFRFERSGDYLLEVRDVRYQGNAEWTYAIEVSNRPFVTQITPLALPIGQTTQVGLVGLNLATNTSTSFEIKPDAKKGMNRLSPIVGGIPANDVGAFLTDLPIISEDVHSTERVAVAADGSNSTLDQPSQRIPVPSVINGTIQRDGEVDRFLFEAKAQERFRFEVFARRLGSQIDPKIRITNESGGVLSEADDSTYLRVLSADPELENWAAPADGKYILEVRDLHSRGGASFPYAVQVTPSKPYFLLEADTDKTLLAPGTSGVVYVKAHRRCGFTGDIQLAVDSLPPGVTAVAGKALQNSSDGSIWLHAAEDAPEGTNEISIRGTAVIKNADGTEETLTTLASNLQEVYMPGGGRGHYPVEMHSLSVAKPMDVRKIQLSSNEFNLKPGGSSRIDITVERAPDYKGNVTLDIMMQHLETPYGNPLPKGVTVDVAASKTLLTGSENSGYITLKAAADAPEVERQLLPINVHVSINFVMKHTICSDPVWVTVAK